MSNGDGTVSWLRLDDWLNNWIEESIKRGDPNPRSLLNAGYASALDLTNIRKK